MKRIDHLILGAGYAGVPIAFRLQRKSIPYLIVNKRPYQSLIALLPELTTGAIKDDEGILWLKDFLSHTMVAEVREIDPVHHTVIVENQDGLERIEYRSLIICLGWVADTFLPANGVKIVEDLPSALAVRKLLYERPRRVVVCGGGFVGVETAGQLAGLSEHMGYEVILLEAADDILANLPEKARAHARKILEEKGVKILCSSHLSEIREKEVLLEDGQRINGDIILWALGVRANPLVAQAGFSTDSKGRGLVDTYLRSVDFENVFFAGDCAGTNQPMLGQIAVQQGKYLGEYLPRLVKGEEIPIPDFKYKGLTVSIGEDEAIAAIGEKVSFSGLLAVVLKKLIGKKYFLDITL